MTEPIRITYDVRRGPREQLCAELHQIARDRADRNPERAAAATEAAQKLADADGYDRVQFEFTAYIVDNEPSRNGLRRGTREWVLAELREGEAGWTHEGNRLLALAHHNAIAEIEHGAARVTVGHIEYEVAAEG